MKPVVLDASALLAMFFGEPGMEKMRDLFHKASEADRPVFISAVNWAEVLYRMERKQGKAGYETARQFERTTPLEAVPPMAEQIYAPLPLDSGGSHPTSHRPLARKAPP